LQDRSAVAAVVGMSSSAIAFADAVDAEAAAAIGPLTSD
jgi:hypothetical protein